MCGGGEIQKRARRGCRHWEFHTPAASANRQRNHIQSKLKAKRQDIVEPSSFTSTISTNRKRIFIAGWMGDLSSIGCMRPIKFRVAHEKLRPAINDYQHHQKRKILKSRIFLIIMCQQG